MRWHHDDMTGKDWAGFWLAVAVIVFLAWATGAIVK